MTLQELIDKKNSLKQELIELEKEIARHPETIKAAFKHNPMWNMDVFENLIKDITFARWSGYEEPDGTINSKCIFVLSEVPYALEARFERLTSIFKIIENNNFHYLEIDKLTDLWDQDDPVTFLKDQGYEDWKIIGCLLSISCKKDL